MEDLDKYLLESQNKINIIDVSKDFMVDKNFNNYFKIDSQTIKIYFWMPFKLE